MISGQWSVIGDECVRTLRGDRLMFLSFSQARQEYRGRAFDQPSPTDLSPGRCPGLLQGAPFGVHEAEEAAESATFMTISMGKDSQRQSVREGILAPA